MDAVHYEIRNAGAAVYIDRSAGFVSRMAMTCLECGARVGLALTARGEDTWITCPQGHTTRDWRLTPEAVRDVATAADAGVDVVPADAEIWSVPGLRRRSCPNTRTSPTSSERRDTRTAAV